MDVLPEQMLRVNQLVEWQNQLLWLAFKVFDFEAHSAGNTNTERHECQTGLFSTRTLMVHRELSFETLATLFYNLEHSYPHHSST